MSEEVLFCCVCGHNLNSHVSEKTVWRCHALGKDCFQCECALRKDRAENKINYYDLKEREKEWRKEQAKKREGLCLARQPCSRGNNEEGLRGNAATRQAVQRQSNRQADREERNKEGSLQEMRQAFFRTREKSWLENLRTLRSKKGGEKEGG